MDETQIEVVFSFDTTGSMRPCIAQVQRKVESTFAPLIKEIPDLRIGICAHGDYCDARTSYVTKRLDLTSNLHTLTQFVRNVGYTGGGDSPECYELVLHEARKYNWSVNSKKVLVMIGDEVPHAPHESQNTLRLNWRDEAKRLADLGVVVYGVQCLSKRHANSFYGGLADITGGYHLALDQFDEVVDLIMAICYKQMGPAQLSNFEASVEHAGRMNRTLDNSFRVLSGRTTPSARFKPVAKGLVPVPPGRFQMLDILRSDVDPETGKVSIRDFVLSHDLEFKQKKGFYEFTKTETIQEKKEVVLRDKITGDMFTGPEAREMIGLPMGTRGRLKPADLKTYDVFVRSDSYNRALLQDTRFLYEVDLDR